MLYADYRPTNLKEVVGQEQNLVTLREQIKIQKYDSAYLFNGHRGTGKTSIARILSRSICCISTTEDGPCNVCQSCKTILTNSTLDFVELDAASHSSINDIKELISSTQYAPTVLSRKIYIIDEVHNLSSSAFDALLKTIEEPPAHCIFILCTTELHKIPATIKSRCSIYQFSAISISAISERLILVLNELNKDFEIDAINLIAKQADGSMRDALSIMEKLIISCNTLTIKHVKTILCLMDDEISIQILSSIIEREGIKAIELLKTIYGEGKNLAQLVDNLLQTLTDGVVLYSSKDMTSVYNTETYKATLYNLVNECDIQQLFWYIDQFCVLREKIRNSLNPYMDVMLYIIKCCNSKLFNESTHDILKRLSALENQITEGMNVQIEYNSSTEIISKDNITEVEEKSIIHNIDIEQSEDVEADENIEAEVLSLLSDYL